MKKHIHTIRELILPMIDFFHPLFRRIMPLRTFRYAACGGINAVLSFVVYFICLKYVFKEQLLQFDFYAFTPHSAALFASFLFGFPFGFFLMKYVVFNDSRVKGKVQLFRYLVIYLFNLALNYIALKVFVEIIRMDAVLAQVISTFMIIVISYIAQRYFTFRIKEVDDEKEITD